MIMKQILEDYLIAAEANLAGYYAIGDENAIRAGEAMVESFKAELAKLEN